MGKIGMIFNVVQANPWSHVMRSRLNTSPLQKVIDRQSLTVRVLGFLSVLIVSAAIGCGSAGDNGKASSENPSPDAAEETLSADDAKRAEAEQRVVIDTSLGKITVELDSKNAELTVSNFLRYVDEGHYDQTIFHEVNSGYAVLGGGYTKDLTAKATHPPIRNEAHNGLKNLRGTIAMVRKPDVIDSANCQFLFNLADNPGLDHKDAATAEGYGYCVFGKVIDGMDVLDRIGGKKVHEATAPDGEPFQNVPVEAIEINSIKRR